MMIPLAKAALSAELRIYWLNLCERVLSITLTCIWCWGISFLVLRNMEYTIITITPRFALTLSGGCCYVLLYGLNRSVWKLFGLYSRLVFYFWFLINELVGAKQDRLTPSRYHGNYLLISVCLCWTYLLNTETHDWHSNL